LQIAIFQLPDYQIIKLPNSLDSVSQCRHHLRGGCVITERIAYVNKAIYVSRLENKGSAKLHGVFPQTVLAVPAGPGALARDNILAPQKMQQRSLF
jgi:hypothetical protein